MRKQIEESISQLREKYGLDDYNGDRALITAPMGQEYFDLAIKRLTHSRAVMKLSKKSDILVIVVTSEDVIIKNCPKHFHIVKIGEIGNWPSGDIYKSRFVKWAIPILFKNIKTSVYIDCDLIITDKKNRLLNIFNITEREGFFVTEHNIRTGWQDEFNAILNYRYLNMDMLNKQSDLFLKSGIPEKGPVFQTNFLGRIHNSKYDILSRKVLEQFFEYSERDQLGLIYAIYECGLSPFALPEGEVLYSGFVRHINNRMVTFVDPLSMEARYNYIISGARDCKHEILFSLSHIPVLAKEKALPFLVHIARLLRLLKNNI